MVEAVTYISLQQAAKKYNLPEDALLNRVRSGNISTAQLPSGEILVAEHEVDPSLNITRDEFEHLRGQSISLAEAGRKYHVSQPSISNWVKSRYIRVLVEPELRGQKKLIDEADVAYCAAVYKAKRQLYGGQLAGVPIFDEEGKPYQVKYPEMAAERRKDRQQKKKR